MKSTANDLQKRPWLLQNDSNFPFSIPQIRTTTLTPFPPACRPLPAINLCRATCEFMATAIATTKCGGPCAVSRGSDKFADGFLQWVREGSANAIIEEHMRQKNAFN